MFLFHRFPPLTLGLALVWVGCSPEPQSADSLPPGAKVLHIGNEAEPSSLDPQITTGLPEMRIHWALFEGLITLDPDTLEPRGGVAERWTISPDGRTWTFYLRPDLTWSDGTPLTAEAFRFSWRRLLSPALGADYASQLYPVRGAEAYHRGETDAFSTVGIDVPAPDRLVVTLEQPIPYFLTLLAHPATYPVPEHAITAHGAVTARANDWVRPGNHVGNGPFRLTDWQVNARVSVEKNPAYRDADQVALEGIRFFPIEQNSTEERAFRAGQLHLTSNVPLDRLDWYRENHPEWLQSDPDLGTYYFLINTREPPFDDPRVRRALALSLDREAIARYIRRRGEPPAWTFVPPGMPGYRAPAVRRRDVEAAQALLAEAGYPGGEGFPPVELLFNTSEQHRAIAEAVQAMWGELLGIRIDLVNQEWKVYLDTRRNGAFQLARASWFGDYLDPGTFLELWTTEATNNFSGWSDPVYDRLVATGQDGTLPEQARMDAYREAEQRLIQAAPIIPVFFYNRTFLRAPNVTGWPSNILHYTQYKRVDLQTAPPESE
ncbi:MAG: peptide ABC transporter substrate-binding protein [Opitutales bacterium]